MKQWGMSWLGALAVASGLAACADTPAPPVRYYQLRVDAPVGVATPSVSPSNEEVWQLISPVRVPEYLDRDTLWLAVGANALEPLDGHRWAEPLRTALPKTLAHDLGLLRGGRVWAGNVPSGLTVTRQLRLDVLEFGPSLDRRTVRLRATWAATSTTTPATTSAATSAASEPPAQALSRSRPWLGEADIQVPSTGTTPAELVDAHRLALWELAQRMARQAGSPLVQAPQPTNQ